MASKVTALPVVTLDTGVIAGEIRDVLIDSDDGRISGFTVRGRGLFGARMKGWLSLDDVVSIGHDAILIPAETRLSRDAGLGAAVRAGRDVLGDRVLSDEGRELGRVHDVLLELDRSEGSVLGLNLKTRRGFALVSWSEAHSVSGHAAVVPRSVVMRRVPHTGFLGRLLGRRESDDEDSDNALHTG